MGDAGSALGVTLPAFVLLFVVSGACGLVYQVVWSRQLVPVFGVTAFVGSTIAAAGAGLALVAVAAAMLPAWRASRLDPNVVLRAD